MASRRKPKADASQKPPPGPPRERCPCCPHVGLCRYLGVLRFPLVVPDGHPLQGSTNRAEPTAGAGVCLRACTVAQATCMPRASTSAAPQARGTVATQILPDPPTAAPLRTGTPRLVRRVERPPASTRSTIDRGGSTFISAKRLSE